MKRVKWILLGLVFLSPLAAIVAFVPVGGSNTLLGQATRIGPARNWGMHYFWLDDRRILTFRAKGADAQAIEVDSRSGKETTLLRLSDTFRGFRATGERHLSPDGKWLLWTAQDHGAPRWHVVASRLDGTKRMSWEGGMKTAWTPDSSRWVQLRTVKQKAVLRIQDIEGGKRQEVAIPQIKNQPRALPGNTAVLQGEFLGPTAAGNYLLANTHAVFGTGNKTYLFDLNASQPAESECHTVTIPSGALLVKLSRSPDGRKLLWVAAGVMEPSPLTQLIWKILPRFESMWQRTIEIWISDTDGASMKNVAVHAYDTGMFPHRFGEGVNWMPDGRRISFVLDNALYSLSAD